MIVICQLPDKAALQLRRQRDASSTSFWLFVRSSIKRIKCESEEYLLFCNHRVVQQWGLCGRRRLALGEGLCQRAIVSSVSQGGE